MKKRVCIFLICWLPCFVLAANVMSMQMLLAQTVPVSQGIEAGHASHDVQEMSEMPCHQHPAEHSPDGIAPKTHHCDICGFCAVSSGVAHFHVLAHLPATAASTVAPLYLAAPVHSQTYPPAIKPPIFS
jgi:hypothetical protein